MQVSKNFPKPKAGFTLMELLVSVVIISFLGGAIYFTFAQGVRVWHAAVRKSHIGQQELFFEKFKSELRNAYRHTEPALNGKSQMIEFCTLIPRMSGSHLERQTSKVAVRIRYRFDPVQKVIIKETDLYEKILNPKNKTFRTETVLENVSGGSFEYYYYPKKGSAASWVSKWSEPCFPDAVKVTMGEAQLARIFSMPATYCSEKEDDEAA